MLFVSPEDNHVPSPSLTCPVAYLWASKNKKASENSKQGKTKSSPAATNDRDS